MASNRSIPGGVIVKGDNLMDLVRQDRRSEQYAHRAAPKRPTPRQQSDRAVELIGSYGLDPAAARVANSVAKAFLAAKRTGDDSRTKVAKEMVKEWWTNASADKRGNIHQTDLNNGLAAGAKALNAAGRELFAAFEDAVIAFEMKREELASV